MTTAWVLGTIAIVVVVLLVGAWVLWNALIDGTGEPDAAPETTNDWCQWCNRVSATQLLDTEDACCNRCFVELFDECPSCHKTVESRSIFEFKGYTVCAACGPDEAYDE